MTKPNLDLMNKLQHSSKRMKRIPPDTEVFFIPFHHLANRRRLTNYIDFTYIKRNDFSKK